MLSCHCCLYLLLHIVRLCLARPTIPKFTTIILKVIKWRGGVLFVRGSSFVSLVLTFPPHVEMLELCPPLSTALCRHNIPTDNKCIQHLKFLGFIPWNFNFKRRKVFIDVISSWGDQKLGMQMLRMLLGTLIIFQF